jgi:hypothetical protein
MNALPLAVWLAQDPGPKGPEFGGSSPIGLVVTLLMLVAVVVLVRSMNTHLRKVPKSFDQPEQADAGAEQAEGKNAEGTNTEPPAR